MDDIVLKTDLDGSTSLYVSPISRQTYDEHVDDDSLGGERGYFVMRSRSIGGQRLEVLAKAPSLEAAEILFNLIVSLQRKASR
jgi:hypothetical protein